MEALHRHEVVEGWLRKSVASFFLMFRDEYAFGYFVVDLLSTTASVVKLCDAHKAVFGHLIGGDEYRLCLFSCPLVESLVVETSISGITLCVHVGNIAVNYAVFRYGDFRIVNAAFRY